MTIEFLSDKDVRLLFKWENCSFIPRYEESITHDGHIYKVIGLSWTNQDKVCIGLHKII